MLRSALAIGITAALRSEWPASLPLNSWLQGDWLHDDRRIGVCGHTEVLTRLFGVKLTATVIAVMLAHSLMIKQNALLHFCVGRLSP